MTRCSSLTVRSPLSHVRTRVWMSLLGLLVVFGVAAAVPSAQALRQSAPSVAGEQNGLYDLQSDERLGGHTLARHVGRTDAELQERLRREPQISAASTWTDVQTARRTVFRAVEQSRDQIDAWASRRGGRPNLALHYVDRSGTPLGRSLSRGQQVTRPCDRALVVLKWLERERRWIVLTSYPETRR